MDTFNELAYIVNSFRTPNEPTEILIQRIIHDDNLIHACASICSSLNYNIEMVKLILNLPEFKQQLDE